MLNKQHKLHTKMSFFIYFMYFDVKGGTEIVIDAKSYEAEGLQQLLNTKYYKEIQAHGQETAQETAQEINTIVRRLYNKGIIDD